MEDLLNSFALDNVLQNLGIDAGDGFEAAGLGKRGNRADRDLIYAEGPVEDDSDGPDSPIAENDSQDEGRDVEGEIDEEGSYSQPRHQFPQSGTFRGEDDDYDDDSPMQPAPRYGQANGVAAFDFGLEGEDQQFLAAEEDMPGFLNGQNNAIDINAMFPAFSQDLVMDLTELSILRPRKKPRLTKGTIRYTLPPAGELEEARSTRDTLNSKTGAVHHDTRLQRNKIPLAPLIKDVAPKIVRPAAPRGVHIDQLYGDLNAEEWRLPDAEKLEGQHGAILVDDWEDEIIWSGAQKTRQSDEMAQSSLLSLRRSGEPLPFRNKHLDSGEWSRSIIWDHKTPYTDFTKLQIDVSDPNLLVEHARDPEDDGDASSNVNRKRKMAVASYLSNSHIVDPYNLSNDKIYEDLRQADKRKVIRQTFGALEVLHAYPALKLQLPLYRTNLTKVEARAWHRPPLQFPLNIPITFTKISSTKKKHKSEKALGPSSMNKADNPIKNTEDLSLRDSASFILTEFTEEYPPVISNIGMGSILVNYYRKKDPKDEHFPKVDLGEQIILDEKDESPFMKLGSVDPGQVVPTLYNNLFRAPMFKHAAPVRDFLAVKVTMDGITSYYIRDIKHMYTVGQTYYVTEVPGPHSRKFTAMNKNRLQAIAARLCERSEHNRIRLIKLLRFFPDQTDLQMRQKLKEFMEFVRKGSDQGFWMMKSTAKSVVEALREVRPEDIVLSEAMQVGQRHLLDAGFGGDDAGTNDNIKEEDVMKLDVEQQLAPWVASKNFLATAAGKAMLKLHGEGDPTGRGEGFNFQRVSMKEIFLREGETMEERQAEIARRPKSSHKYNVAEQQDIYRQEVDRIWRTQFKSLTNRNLAVLTTEDEVRYRKRQRAEELGLTPGQAMPETPFDGYGMPSPGLSMLDSEDERFQYIPKILRIKRYNAAGECTTEIVREQAVIKSYIREKEAHELELLATTDIENLAPGQDAAQNAKLQKALAEKLARARHNQERRMQRKGVKAGPEDPNVPDGDKPKLPRAIKAETTRRCGNCGQVGHMKTNRKCPRWAEFNGPNANKSSQPGVSPVFDGNASGSTTPAFPGMESMLNPFA